MRKISFEFLFPLVALIVLVFALSQQISQLPPFGKLLDPFIGAIQNEKERQPGRPGHETHIPGMNAAVSVYFDSRNIPHIYAKNTKDLYFAQGYITAGQRLWQMDFLSYASGGRLAEIGGERFLDYDRNQRRIGILQAARTSLQLIEQDAEANEILTAYTAGVNAYIKTLHYAGLPFEFKMFDYRPEPWTKLKSVLIMKSMANLLSGFEKDFSLTNLMLALGEKKFNKFFGEFNDHITPVVTGAAAPVNRDLAYLKKPDYLDFSFMNSGSVIPKSSYNPSLGSNSWVVSGNKTKSGFPILCNDPHLNLSLPAMWMEMQLAAPGLNVYGVSIPGTPAIIIGFNENIAWGLTNGGDDVKDWYKLKITGDYKNYEMDGKLLELPYRLEEIKIRGQKTLYDTAYYTVHGPIVHTAGFPGSRPELLNHALHWELHTPSNEFLTFIHLNKSKNYADFSEAIRHYVCPIQNFTFAGRRNTIAVSHQGNMRVKWPGQGKFILDGTRSAHVYNRYIPRDSLPAEVNPASHYIVSANQHPTANNYSYYYNGNFSEKRANRINEILDRAVALDTDSMKAMQLDNTSSFAEYALPVLLPLLDGSTLNEDEKKRLQSLRSWKGAYNAGDENAYLFHYWLINLRDYTWDELKEFSFTTETPDDYILVDLIGKEPGNEYFDRLGTTQKENAADIVSAAFSAAVKKYNSIHNGKPVTWAERNRISINHLLNIGQFGVQDLPSAGNPDAINALSENWGPGWRMIVELGERPNAYGIYPGGQSGDIGSRNYDNFVGDWNKGKYYRLQFFISAREAEQTCGKPWTMK